MSLPTTLLTLAALLTITGCSPTATGTLTTGDAAAPGPAGTATATMELPTSDGIRSRPMTSVSCSLDGDRDPQILFSGRYCDTMDRCFVLRFQLAANGTRTMTRVPVEGGLPEASNVFTTTTTTLSTNPPTATIVADGDIGRLTAMGCTVIAPTP